MKIAAIFPGQGAQKPGMGRDFYENFSRARDVFDEADEILGQKFSDIIFHADMETLSLTKNSQLAIFITSVAIFEVLKEQVPDLQFTAMGGLSLGEYTALYASGQISFADALRLVAERGRLMHEAATASDGTMAAVLGMSEEQIAPHLKSGVWIANLNCPGQVVISGEAYAVKETMVTLKEAGAKRVIPLDVSGAFHSGLMSPARERLAPTIDSTPLMESTIGFLMNVPGDYVENHSDIRANLSAQVVEPVKWESCVRAMMREGIEQFIEIGPGKTLAGMNRKIGAPNTLSIEKVEHLDSLLIEVVR